MKKILTILCLTGLLCGCADKNVYESSLPDLTTEAVSETSAASADPTTEMTAEPVSEEKAESSSYPLVSELYFAEPDSDDMLNKSRTIFFTDNGYYCYAEIGGRDSANYVLSFDSGDGNYAPIENGEDCIWSFADGDTIYGVQHYTRNANSLMSTICKYKDGAITPIAEIGYLSPYYFTDGYIYYCDDEKNIRRMDYNGESIEEIAALDHVGRFAVHDGKIWYDADDHISVYDIETGGNADIMINPLSYGNLRFNGSYMYCIDSKLRLIRINTDDYNIEVVSGNAKCFDFCGEYIIYSVYKPDLDFNGKLYRMGSDGNTEIFDAKELLVQDYYYEIDTIQCDDGRIFVDISSGPYYSYVAELDINGNLLKEYYETKSWNQG